jgi:curved DNA-binding protein CbpA
MPEPLDERPDPYKVLQVDPEADPEVVQAAYRRLAQKYHPDTTVTPDAYDRIVAINAAWEVLKDPVRRAAYDAKRRGERVAPAPAPAAGGPSAPVSPYGPAQGPTTGGASASRESAPAPQEVSRDWTSGRSTMGGGYDPGTMGRADGMGAAGPPPGNPSGSVMNFGRYSGWSLGEIARADIEYIEWLDRTPIGRPYREEIDQLLRRAGRRRAASPEATQRRGLFRRR